MKETASNDLSAATRLELEKLLQQWDGHGYTYAAEKAGMRYTFSRSTLEIIVMKFYSLGLLQGETQISNKYELYLQHLSWCQMNQPSLLLAGDGPSGCTCGLTALRLSTNQEK